MNNKSTISIAVCVLLSICLTCAFAPSAFATSTTSLKAGSPDLTTQAKAKKSTPRPNKVRSLKVTSKKVGKATISWKTPKKVKRLKKQTYTVRYAYNKAMKSAKTKTTSKLRLTLSKLKQGKKLYVQVRTNAKYGKKTVRSKWSAKKAVTVKKTAAKKSTSTATKTPTSTPSTPAASKPAPTNVDYQSATMPTNVSIAQGSVGQVNIAWKKSAYACETFDVRWSYSPTFSDYDIKTVDANTLKLTLNNLEHNKTLYVQVRSRGYVNEANSSIISNWSPVKSITVPGIWVPEQGHWEPVYETVIDKEAWDERVFVYIFSDGHISYSREDFENYCNISDSPGSNASYTVHHEAETHQEQVGQTWVVDVEGHWE